MASNEQGGTLQKRVENFLKTNVTRRRAIGGLVGSAATVAVGAIAYDRLQEDDGLSKSEIEILEFRASRLYGQTDAQIEAHVNKSLLNKYKLDIEDVSIKALAEAVGDHTAGFMFPVRADFESDTDDRGMFLLVDSVFDEANNWLGSRIRLGSSPSGDVLPEFADLGMVKFQQEQATFTNIPRESLIPIANAAFNLPPDVQWGEGYTMKDVSRDKEILAMEGMYMPYGRPARVAVSENGVIMHEVGQVFVP